MASNTTIFFSALGDGQHGVLAASQAAEAQDDAGLRGLSASRRCARRPFGTGGGGFNRGDWTILNWGYMANIWWNNPNIHIYIYI